MAGAMVSASSSLMNPVIGKLTSLLGDEYKLVKDSKDGIRFLRDELSTIHALLERLSGMEEQINEQTKEWRNKVRELSYDIEDCIDRFMHRHSLGDAKANFVRKSVRKMKALWEDRRIGKEIQELKALVVEQCDRRNRYNIDQLISLPQPVPLDPRAHALYEEAKNLVGIVKPREEIIEWLKGEEKQLKVVSIFGIGGLGKTTLAMEVYRKIEESFDCRASVSVSRTPDIKKLLRDLLFQINDSDYDRSEKWDKEQLIPTLRNNLKDKRYFIVIDDIWSISAWDELKLALPINGNRGRIITTTRIEDVAKSCCTDFVGLTYEAKPLSEDDSHSLFYTRVFGSSEDCPQELTEVANEILRKCGGLPLAIISIASLLANKSQTVEAWVKIRNSISSAVEKGSSVEKMKSILFLSYFDLPHYLKSCLLYLSVFPEDYSIYSRHLIWMWVAEGLISGQNRESLEREGENYLNELINRSMIQPTRIRADGTVICCRVHDIVLDFLISQAVEDNFIATLNGDNFCGTSSNKIRRLSLQSKFCEVSEFAKAMKDASHLRSVHMFGSVLPEQRMNQILNSQVLRVLNIEVVGEWSLGNIHMENIGSFCQLKYLKINCPAISKLPEAIGKLQLLEILDLTGCLRISKLPTSIVQLQKLVRLTGDRDAVLPDGIGSLQALEELSCFNIDYSSIKAVQGLGELTKLRDLKIFWGSRYTDCDEGRMKACTSSLSKLIASGLRSLHIWYMEISDAEFSCMFSCGSPTPLQILVCRIPTIPSRIGSLVNLTSLCIENVREAGEEAFKILASLPVLLFLYLILSYDVPHQRQVVGSQGFPRLVEFRFRAADVAGLMFEPGSMPKLQRLQLELQARWQLKHGGLIFGLQHLSGLKHITVDIDCIDAAADEVEGLEGDIRGAASIHPNRPILEIETWFRQTPVHHDAEIE